ncbi:uncharacterized protein E0L32_008486 [Thyridium curvatum]|uniref:CFEM domain-containing protein n=1 Tax=Thyridium curvatum TaxID=1093900 RepID=A0A507B222_9PEZI|nr:uncharacterized protein E0L32_008486 [Thyridium curvatum]TPX10600.1 hypothetical protein E0L32_008486 [Thyridium curvatum]
MKSVSVLGFAAGAAATFGFHNAPPFTCPENTDNKCTPKQIPGFDFNDATPGPFNNYDGFDFFGWECKSGSGRRDRFDARTFGGKSIFGSCGPDKQSSPSFGCGKGGQTDKFSLGGIHVIPEFDCDLEFHYDMPDGSQCKHRSPCSSKGTWVKNNQCGGAKNVTIVYPPQPQKPKKTCGVHVPSMTFDCGTKSIPPPTKPATKPATTKPATTAPPTKPVTTPAVPTTSVDTDTCSDEESTTTPATKPATTPSSPGVTTPTQSKPSETQPTQSKPSETKPTQSKPTQTTPGQTTTSNSPGSSTSSVPSVGTPSVSTGFSITTTSFMSTSTIFTTSVSTITSCAPTVPNCPAGSVTTTIVTVPVSTTICPVTETRSVPVSKPVESKPPQQSTTTGNSPVSSPSKPAESLPATSTKPKGPEETLPCPAVVPQCLNTFLFKLSCSDNTDHACYCPDKLFVENVFSCIYAHGESDTIVSQAVVFFQGLCAPYVPKNPAIVTGATVTTYITVTATPTVPAQQQTTVIVDQTTVVPCTDESGSTIPNSSTTVTISTAMTVPQVGFTTTAGTVNIVPGPTNPAGPAETGKVSPPGATNTKNSPVGGGAANPTGTGAVKPTPTGGFATVNAGGRTSAGFGLAGFVVMAVAALL